MITPIPGFVIKTLQLNGGSTDDKDKVLINLCSHEDIEVPGMKKRLNPDGESVEGMNIPMSVGQGRTETDSKGSPCTVYDIIVNPLVITDVRDDVTGKYRDFICQLCMQYIESKYKIELDKRYKLPKLRYMGDESHPEQQYVQDRKNMPKIEELSSTKLSDDAAKKSATQKMSTPKPADIDLPYELRWIDENMNVIDANPVFATEYIDPVSSLPSNAFGLAFTAEVIAPSIGPSDVDVQMSPYKVQLKIAGYKHIKFYLPSVFDPVKTSGSLRRAEGYSSKFIIKLCLLLDNRSPSVEADPGSKPWLMSAALSGEEDDEEGNNVYSRSRDKSEISDQVDEKADDISDTLPEDKYHIRLPKNVDKYTGVQIDESTADELPEERFHRMDASSSYLISQREQAIKDKNEKFERFVGDEISDTDNLLL